jgi:hypothetical protein
MRGFGYQQEKCEMRKVHGVGVNDTTHMTFHRGEDGQRKKSKTYTVWQNMLQRCYCPKRLAKYPTYIGCTVSDEWLLFSNFKQWMDQQPWKNRHLDKDILIPGNKIYSPATCCFVTGEVNLLLNDRGRLRGGYPLGVSWHHHHKKFQAQCRTGSGNKRIHLGYFSDQMAAHAAWQAAKALVIRDSAETLTSEYDAPIRTALLRLADSLFSDREQGIETLAI